MNFRNRKLVIVVRVLLGLFFIFSGVGGLMSGQSLANVPAPMVPAMQILWQTGILQYIKVAEIVGGLLLISGFFPALGLLILAPICLGVLIFNGRMSPEYLPMGVIVTALTAYLGYAYWEKFKAIFDRKS